MAVKLVLLEDIENLGRVGEVVSVRGGYGRNFLIPQGKALAATKGNLAMMGQQRKVYEVAAAKVREDAQVIADKLATTTVRIARKVGDNDTLYGSVTTGDIAEGLVASGVKVDKRRLVLAEPIKQLGEYKVTIRLHPEVMAEFAVAVVKE